MARDTLLLVNRTKLDVARAVPEVRRIIQPHARVVAELDTNGQPIDPAHAAAAQLIVVLGGDGTLLSQTRRCAALALPMLGVNLGNVGYMAEFDLDSLQHHAQDIFGSGPLTLRHAYMLHAEIRSADGSTRFQGLALNDAVVTAGPPYRMIELDVLINNQPGPRVRGDGLILATALGSTAYNASAGGAIIAPHVDALALTPLAAQSLAFRPIVIDAASEVDLHILRANEWDDHGGGTTLVLDGQVHAELKPGDVVSIRRHPVRVEFVRDPGTSYWDTLIRKMRWAAPPRTRHE